MLKLWIMIEMSQHEIVHPVINTSDTGGWFRLNWSGCHTGGRGPWWARLPLASSHSWGTGKSSGRCWHRPLCPPTSPRSRAVAGHSCRIWRLWSWSEKCTKSSGCWAWTRSRETAQFQSRRWTWDTCHHYHHRHHRRHPEMGNALKKNFII